MRFPLIIFLISAVFLAGFAQSLNNCLDFDGTDDYVNCGNHSSLDLTSAITIEAWIFYQGGESYPRITEKYPAPSIYIRESNDLLGWHGEVGGVERDFTFSNSTIPRNQWTHIAVTYDGNYIRSYINGVYKDWEAQTGVLATTTNNLLIGSNSDGDRSFDGKIEELRIWSTARTAANIRENMFKSLEGNESGLVAYYPFDHSSGTTLNDASLNSNDGTLTNMSGNEWVTSGAFAGPRNDLDFDGDNDYVDCGNNSSLNVTDAITIESWIYYRGGESYPRIIEKYPAPSIHIHTSNDLLGWHGEVGGVDRDFRFPNSTIPRNKWTHIAVTYDGSYIRSYINGDLRYSEPQTGALTTTTAPLLIGNNSATDRTFDGEISELRIWNDARTPTEIRDNMCSSLIGDESGLVAFYRFDQSAGTTLYDWSTNSNHGTLTNMTEDDWTSSYAYNTWVGCEGANFADNYNWSTGTAPNSTTVNVGITNYSGGNQPAISGDYTSNHLSINSGATLTINSGRTLTVNGSAFISGTQSGDGKIELTGASASHVLAGAFNNLELDESSGAELDGDATINGILTLTNGTFTIGDNTLTYINNVAGTTANLSGGSTSSITISGSGSGVIIPSSVIELNNFTLDNSNGTTLQTSMQLAGTLTLTNGAMSIGANTLTLEGAVSTSSGSLTGGASSNISFGGSGVSTNLQAISLNNLTINRGNGIGLSGDVTVDGTLTLTNGDLELNGQTITFGTAASLSESEGNTVTGSSGTITTTRTFNAGDLSAGVNIAGLGAKITTTQALGSTTITRGHQSYYNSILRYFDINPTNNSSLNAELVFNYDDSELNNNTESGLQLLRSIDSGSSWTVQGGTVDTENETITLSGIDAFSRWTAIMKAFVYVTSLTGVSDCSAAWGDYDNDGDLDILLTGMTSTGYIISYIYRNDGSDTFTHVVSLTGVFRSSVAWGDYDNDGDLDILLTGYSSSGVSRVYRNNGSDNFTLAVSLTGVYYSGVAWGDYDNDGDLDILLTGSGVSRIYRNDGTDTFTNAVSLNGVERSSAAWGDYDNDGDLDILLTGVFNSSRISLIYRNDGSNTFTDISAGLTGVRFSSAAWGDYDNDGDLDILLTGESSSGNISRIYRNDGSDTFTHVESLTGVEYSSVAWGDYDNDGDLDILLTGDSGSYISKIYRNDGSDTFSHIESLTGVGESSVAWGDYDNDGDLDILLTGNSSSEISYIYRNDGFSINTVPNAPTNLSASLSGNDVTLSWDKSTDNETAQNGLTYNIRIGTSSGGVQSLSPMANVSNGYRRIPALGNTNHNNSWEIKDLSSGISYYWSVQTIDNCFTGSGFAAEGTFGVISISTASITNITKTTADGGGNVTFEGGFSVTAKGIVWGTNQNPTIDSYAGKTNDGNGLGSFTSSLTGLTSGQTYYVRAYATNSQGTSYGEQKNFTPNMIPPGKALDFDGDNDYVNCGNDASLNLTGTITIESWVYYQGGETYPRITEKYPAPSIYILQSSSELGWYGEVGGSSVEQLFSNAIIPTNTWTHIAVTYDGSAIKAYVNGVEKNSEAHSGDLSVTSNPLTIGGNTATNRTFDGKLDEVRIWSDVRTSTEIHNNMHKTLNGDESGLVAYYRFDHISGTALSDRTTNDNDGTLNNMTNDDWVGSTAIWKNWEGTAKSTTWGTPANWSTTFSDPTSYDMVLIPSGGTQPHITNDPVTPATCDILKIESGAILTIDAGKALTVSDTIMNEAGTTGLVLKSNSSGTATLIHETENIDAGAERYIPQYSGNNDWHFLSSCVAAQAIRPGFVNSGTPNASNDFFKYDEVTNYWINTKNESGEWNTAFEDNFIVGRGYNSAYNENVTKTFTGELNTGDFTFNESSTPAITYTSGQGEGWNLIGNPYPSAFDWDECSKTNIDASVYSYAGEAGQYKSWNGTVGGLTGGIIPPGNGFFIKVSSGASLTIPNSSRVHTATNFYKETTYVKDLLKLKVEGNGYTDETYILFNEYATTGFDKAYDAYKIFGIEEAPQLYTKTNDSQLSINVLPYATEEITIPLNLVVGTEKEYKISVTENSFWETVSISLKDLQSGQTYNLRTQTEVILNHSPDNSPERFLLYINGATSIEEILNEDNNIEIYSYADRIFIQTKTEGDLQISVYNLLGQTLLSKRFTDQSNIDLRLNKEPGLYIISIQTDNEIKTKKIFIE
jgi:hypothetical protein